MTQPVFFNEGHSRIRVITENKRFWWRKTKRGDWYKIDSWLL